MGDIVAGSVVVGSVVFGYGPDVVFGMWQIKSVFKKIKTGIRNGQSQYYSDFI